MLMDEELLCVDHWEAGLVYNQYALPDGMEFVATYGEDLWIRSRSLARLWVAKWEFAAAWAQMNIREWRRCHIALLESHPKVDFWGICRPESIAVDLARFHGGPIYGWRLLPAPLAPNWNAPDFANREPISWVGTLDPVAAPRIPIVRYERGWGGQYRIVE